VSICGTVRLRFEVSTLLVLEASKDGVNGVDR